MQGELEERIKEGNSIVDKEVGGKGNQGGRGRHG